MNTVEYTFTGQFIRNTILILKFVLINQDICNISLTSCSMLTWLHGAIPEDFSGAPSSSESSVLPHPKDFLIDLDLVTGNSTEEQLNSLLCSWNQLEMTFTLWHAALSCWKRNLWIHDVGAKFWPYHLYASAETKIHKTVLSFPAFYCPVLVSLCPLCSQLTVLNWQKWNPKWSSAVEAYHFVHSEMLFY